MIIYGDQCSSRLGIDMHVVYVTIFYYSTEQLLINLRCYEYLFQPIEADLRMCTVVNDATIASDTGLQPVWRQAII